jgi:hypothetical protein
MTRIVLLICLSLLSLGAREVVDETGACKINWSQGFITCEGESAEGQSSYAAKISAKVIAQRNLLEVIKGVSIDSQVRVADGMLSSDIITSRVQGVIKGAQITSNNYSSTSRSAIATAKLEMGKDLLSALLSDSTKLSWNEKIKQAWDGFSFLATANAATYTNQDKETLQKLLEDLRKQGENSTSKYLTKVLSEIDNTSYSGILIDISDIESFQKAMIVKLVDESGTEIYPSTLVSKETLLKKNTSVGYIYGIEDARNNKRVFDKPIEFKASKIYKNRKSNIVLSKTQIEAIKNLDEDVLKKAKVILVLGE